MKESTHIITYYVAALICAAGWFVQLGGLSALQARCSTQKTLEDNNVRPIIALLENAQVSLGAISQMPPGVAQQTAMMGYIAKTYPGVMSSIKTLTSRSSSVFTLTPDIDCGKYYRYLWINCSLQAFALSIVFYSLIMKIHHRTRVAACSILTLVTVLAIENIHTSYYIYTFLPERVPMEAKVFCGGCITTAVMNIVMFTMFGTRADEPPASAAYVTAADAIPEACKPGDMGLNKHDYDNSSGSSPV